MTVPREGGCWWQGVALGFALMSPNRHRHWRGAHLHTGLGFALPHADMAPRLRVQGPAGVPSCSFHQSPVLTAGTGTGPALAGGYGALISSTMLES